MEDNFTTAQAHLSLLSTTATQKQKFGRLQDTEDATNRIDSDRVVVNLSKRALDPAALAILSKGLNYAHTTSLKSSLKDDIRGVERAVRHLPSEGAEEIKQKTSRIIRHSKPQRRNVCKMERDVLLTLRKDEDITLLPADKGNATKQNENCDERSGIQEADVGSDQENKETNNFSHKEVRHPGRGRQEADPPASIPPTLYGLPKIHKKDVPLRPIVNCIH
jgi:hypothetical protein